MMRSVTTAVTVGLLVAFSAPALAEDSKDPIKMTLHDWTGQLITTRLMGEALKNAGLNVEYVQADYLDDVVPRRVAIDLEFQSHPSLGATLAVLRDTLVYVTR